MAWPSTPYEALVANVTVVHAATHNAFQSGVNGIVNATYSLKSAVIDGTGGNVVVPVAGTVLVSRTVADANEPTTAATVLGELNKESIPAAAANISGGFGNPYRGYGITSVVRNGMGDYTVTFKQQPTAGTATNGVVLVTPTLAVVYTYYTVTLTVAGNLLVAQVIFNGAAADIDFSIVAWML